MPNSSVRWDPDRFFDDLPMKDTPGIKLLLDRAGVLVAGRGESIDKVLKPDQHMLGQSIDTLFPETSGNSGLREAHASALKGNSKSCRQRVSGMDVAWELIPVNTKRGGEVLALAIILRPSPRERCTRTSDYGPNHGHSNPAGGAGKG